MTDLHITPYQRRILRALIAGQSMVAFALQNGKNLKAVQQDLQRLRNSTGLTTYQLVARVAAEMARAEAGA